VLAITRFTSASMALPAGSVCLAFCASEEAAKENESVAMDTSLEEKQLMSLDIVVHASSCPSAIAYGTRLAQYYIKAVPTHVHRAVMAGFAPLDYGRLSSTPRPDGTGANTTSWVHFRSQWREFP